MHIGRIFCKHFCDQIKVLIPTTIGRRSLERTSNLDGVCFKYELLFAQVQCTACKLCQSSSLDKLVLPRMTAILSISDYLLYHWGINCCGNYTRQYSFCLYQSCKLNILFSYQYILSILGKIILLWNRFFQCPATVAFELELVLVFWEKFLELWVQHYKVSILILARERGFYYLPSSILSWLEKKKKDEE